MPAKKPKPIPTTSRGAPWVGKIRVSQRLKLEVYEIGLVRRGESMTGRIFEAENLRMLICLGVAAYRAGWSPAPGSLELARFEDLRKMGNGPGRPRKDAVPA